MFKAIGISIALMLIISFILSILAISGIISGILFVAVIAPLITISAFFFVSFALVAFNQITEEKVGQYIAFVAGALTGATIADIAEWWRKTIQMFQQSSNISPAIYITGTCVIFGLVGSFLGMVTGRQGSIAVQSTVANSIGSFYSSGGQK